jgi:hypothetical protein
MVAGCAIPDPPVPPAPILAIRVGETEDGRKSGMGVSLTGQRTALSAFRHAAATAAVFVGLCAYLYGPPFMPGLSEAAQRECNAMTGSSFRGYALEWQTTSVAGVERPRWVCHDLRDSDRRATSLGWWVDL